jgi:DNA polymerase V
MHIITCGPPKSQNTTKLPLFLAKAACGFPSPADDYIESHLDLNQHLIRHPAATFFIRVEGDSMNEVGILDGDLLIVDRSLSPTNGAIIIAVLGNELTVKQLRIKNNKAYLLPANPKYKTIEVNKNENFHCWGVVTYAIHDVRLGKK